MKQTSEQEARSCLGSFGLSGRIASDVPLRALSGGQKIRVALALLCFRALLLLLLDEVTTHLDTPTITALAKALRAFTGSIVLVTHDRFFSRCVIEGVSPRRSEADDEDASIEDEDEMAPEGKTLLDDEGVVTELPGGMASYVASVRKQLNKAG